MGEPSYPDRFPPPWRIEDSGEAFTVRDANDFPVAYIYFTDMPPVGTGADRPSRDRAWQIAANIAKLPALLTRK